MSHRTRGKDEGVSNPILSEESELRCAAVFGGESKVFEEVSYLKSGSFPSHPPSILDSVPSNLVLRDQLDNASQPT